MHFKINVTLLLVSLWVCITKASSKVSLSLQSARGKMRLNNFYHLHGYRLKVSPQATLEVEKEMKCTTSCIRNKKCSSMNVKKISSNLFVCELLNASKYTNLKNLTRDENFVHWYLQDPCIPSPCFKEASGACVVNSEDGWVTCKCFEKYEGKACETRIYNATQNYALNKPTKASSGRAATGRAVDGNTNPDWYGKSCFETENHKHAPHWWRVDFEEEIQVARVVFTNRGDCCWERMSNFAIKIGNSLEDHGRSNPACGENLSVSQGETKTFACSPPMKGRYLVIQSYRGDNLTICEVEVYA